MGIIAVDLGTTNIKVASYTDALRPVRLESRGVEYIKGSGLVEFDPRRYFDTVKGVLAACYRASGDILGRQAVHLVLTGQAESLVVTDRSGIPIRNGISWLDMRSREECAQLAAVFDQETCYKVTGQPEIIPTWPLTKLLWLKQNQPEQFLAAGKYLLLKDYILFRLTGRFVGEHSIYPFSHYFDITRKTYWTEPLAYCGVSTEQLPELIAPCSVVGPILAEVAGELGLPQGSDVNAGTLDHFAGMIGTGNIAQGPVSESAGTVSSIAAFAATPFSLRSRIPLYCGPFADSYVYLPVCESGGISLEWFKDQFLGDTSFGELDLACEKRSVDPRLTFLPYLTGVNAPEFDHGASGVFYGVTISHDRYDFALAIMYGVASLLRKNIDFFRAAGIPVARIISTGGGAKSALWSQIKADVCNLPVAIPQNQEAPCLGAAIIAAVASGLYPDLPAAIGAAVEIKTVYTPGAGRPLAEQKHQLFGKLYDALAPLFSQEWDISCEQG